MKGNERTEDAQDTVVIRPIARIRSPYREKFGIPRQPGLTHVLSEIHFLPEYRSIDAVRGLEGFDYLWILWRFSANGEPPFRPTVRPPRLGGNTRIGVFATRSSFRPNGLALSSVRIERIDLNCDDAPVITVSGADLMDQTPIYDIKPYLASSDAHPEARSGFADSSAAHFRHLDVTIAPEAYKCGFRTPEAADDSVESNHALMRFREILPDLTEVLSQDPRPAYQNDSARIYGMRFDIFNIRFRISENTVTIVQVEADHER